MVDVAKRIADHISETWVVADFSEEGIVPAEIVEAQVRSVLVENLSAPDATKPVGTLYWDFVSEEGRVSLDKSFKQWDFVKRADFLRDCIYQLEKLYGDLVGAPDRHKKMA